jgi:hypothetical protein
MRGREVGGVSTTGSGASAGRTGIACTTGDGAANTGAGTAAAGGVVGSATGGAGVGEVTVSATGGAPPVVCCATTGVKGSATAAISMAIARG